MKEGSSIVGSVDTLTDIVRAAMSHTDDARLREIVDALVKHAHAFLREARLTDDEFDHGLDFIRTVGQVCHDKHNEVVLLADVLGLSTMVKLLNTQDDGGRTPGALLGPFFRANAPECQDGANIAFANQPGVPLFVTGTVRDKAGRPIAQASVDVWQASPTGLYENQDPEQPDMNLRGRFQTDAQGRFRFRSVRPAGYPVPTDGPVGTLLAKQQRHPYRPAHLHFVVIAEGHETLISQVFADDSEHLHNDVVFGVLRELVGRFELHDDGKAPASDVRGPYCTLACEFVLAEGTPTYPNPPIK
ncbi:MAG TPA: dioxygenase [Trinickia sp.]|nr:dioxygenase [Trinickia sp.]